MKKLKLITIVATLLCITVTGCRNSANTDGVVYSALSTETNNTGNVTFNTDDSNVTFSDADTKKIEDFPYYYKEDYHNEFGDSSIDINGNLVVCLSMIESRYKEIEIPPDMFLINHQELCKNGSESLNSAQIAGFIQSIGLGCVEDTFKLKTASDSIKTLHGCILVYIPHNSIYGKGGSYLLITGIEGQNFIVHDASKVSQDKNKLEASDGDIIYDSTELTAVASKSSKMWIIY